MDLWKSTGSSFIFKKMLMFILGGEWQRERDTESEAGSRFWGVSTDPDEELELTNRELMTWAKVRRLTDWATQAPLQALFYRIFLILGLSDYFLVIRFSWSPRSLSPSHCMHLETQPIGLSQEWWYYSWSCGRVALAAFLWGKVAFPLCDGQVER